MKATLTREGYIKITAETIVEAWALNACWPLDPSKRKINEKNEDRVIVDCGILLEQDPF